MGRAARCRGVFPLLCLFAVCNFSWALLSRKRHPPASTPAPAGRAPPRPRSRPAPVPQRRPRARRCIPGTCRPSAGLQGPKAHGCAGLGCLFFIYLFFMVWFGFLLLLRRGGRRVGLRSFGGPPLFLFSPRLPREGELRLSKLSAPAGLSRPHPEHHQQQRMEPLAGGHGHAAGPGDGWQQCLRVGDKRVALPRAPCGVWGTTAGPGSCQQGQGVLEGTCAKRGWLPVSDTSADSGTHRLRYRIPASSEQERMRQLFSPC